MRLSESRFGWGRQTASKGMQELRENVVIERRPTGEPPPVRRHLCTRRREETVFTKQIKTYGNKDRAKARCEADRYHLLNLTHIARGRGRVEFRAFAGTLNKKKVAGYIMMCLGLVELALATRRCSAWEYTKRDGTRSCWDRRGAGEGETELRRLFYRLGWTRGWYKGANRDKRFGELRDADGRGPDWKAIKDKLLQMAQKYDGRPEPVARPTPPPRRPRGHVVAP